MKEKQFDIKDSDIYEKIKNESGFTAQIKAIAGQPAKQTSMTIATDEEKIFFDGYIQSAVNECIVAISRYLSSCYATEENDTENALYKIRRFNLVLPENYPEENITALCNIVYDYITSRCLQQWYMLTKSDEANVSADKAQTSMTLLLDILSARKKP